MQHWKDLMRWTGRSNAPCTEDNRVDDVVKLRHPSLDVVRGLAILLVIAFHINIPGFGTGGWIGVDLFFVLSGFLISGLLFRDFESYGQIRLGTFWFRRAFRILPPLYVFLATVAFVMLRLHIFNGKVLASAFFFFSNYISSSQNQGSMVGHTWSLAIEEHFYLICPVLLWLLLKHNKRDVPLRPLPFIFVCVAVVCFVLRVLDPQHYGYTHLRVDALFAGVTLRYFEHFRSSAFRYFESASALLIGATFWVLPFTISSPVPLLRSFIFSWTWISAAFLIGWCFAHDRDGFWKTPLFSSVGTIGLASYSIYLWQQPVCLLLKGLSPSWFFKSCGVVFSVLIGMIAARAVEYPSLILRDRLWRDPEGHAVQTTASTAATVAVQD